MANVLSDTKRQQVLALGRLGWPLRRIEDETGVRRETASAYLKAAGIAGAAAGRLGATAATKTGQRGVDRLGVGVDGKTGQWGVDRLGTAAVAPAARSQSAGEHVRALPRADHGGARARPQRHGDLAGPRRSPRLSRRLRERPALPLSPACRHAA